MGLSLEQIYTVARQAGFPAETAPKMVAIAIKESGGNPQAHNAKPPDDSYGLWQINMLGALGPDRRAKLGIATNEALYDPYTNARAAYLLWAGDDANLARHWAITLPGYNSTRYNEVLPQAIAAGQRVESASQVQIDEPSPASGGLVPDWSNFQQGSTSQRPRLSPSSERTLKPSS